MTTTQPSLFTRPDTFFGVCQGIGEDLGIHPNLFRVSFGMAFFFAPLGRWRPISRSGWWSPRRASPSPVATAAAATTEPVAVEAVVAVEEQHELPLAA